MKPTLNSRFHGPCNPPQPPIPYGSAGRGGILLLFFFFQLFISQPALQGEPLASPTWGFSIDLPESYVYSDGDGRNRFSFT
ncbi:MAG: hypothetical protein LBH70_09000, partial [Spirochaetaceae bacterium]|nr:hypothetical protein [Spirochaetaceae bacterium]